MEAQTRLAERRNGGIFALALFRSPEPSPGAVGS
eukprot:CAMPEP_0197907808 /NCGR_PEP_ID=MMETSP1439-20131203/65507_1 /TAXON_ID=66791 /ORGANISM="Gonyaulax spinifera, Strain CCMP409" /LENGTH=33 /DNA_ID= /DNA_START= /DNA_END= /DNA_ORIENTATION=